MYWPFGSFWGFSYFSNSICWEVFSMGFLFWPFPVKSSYGFVSLLLAILLAFAEFFSMSLLCILGVTKNSPFFLTLYLKSIPTDSNIYLPLISWKLPFFIFISVHLSLFTLLFCSFSNTFLVLTKFWLTINFPKSKFLSPSVLSSKLHLLSSSFYKFSFFWAYFVVHLLFRILVRIYFSLLWSYFYCYLLLKYLISFSFAALPYLFTSLFASILILRSCLVFIR